MDEEQFFRFCAMNAELRLERNAHGEIVIMSPEGAAGGPAYSRLLRRFDEWAEFDGTGEVFGSAVGFTLPNGAVRSPDIAWVRKDRLATLTAKQLKRFPHLCPDFVLELRSPSDSMRALQEKMAEYRKNGARLGWLFDPPARRVFIYRPGKKVLELKDPTSLQGDPVLRDFTLDVHEAWRVLT
jgi:Uma2 family endonuclease